VHAPLEWAWNFSLVQPPRTLDSYLASLFVVVTLDDSLLNAKPRAVGVCLENTRPHWSVDRGASENQVQNYGLVHQGILNWGGLSLRHFQVSYD